MSTHIIPAAGNEESCLGPVFRPFSNSHQYRFQIRLRQLDISAFSGQNKVTKTCPKYLLSRYYEWLSQYQILINRSGEIKQYTILSSLYCVCEYKHGRYSHCVSNNFTCVTTLGEPMISIKSQLVVLWIWLAEKMFWIKQPMKTSWRVRMNPSLQLLYRRFFLRKNIHIYTPLEYLFCVFISGRSHPHEW